MKELPLRNYSIIDTLNKLNTVRSLYALNELKEANMLTDATLDFLTEELQYIATLATKPQLAYRDEVQIGLYVLTELERITAGYRQKELNLKTNDVLGQIIKAFHIES